MPRIMSGGGGLFRGGASGKLAFSVSRVDAVVGTPVVVQATYTDANDVPIPGRTFVWSLTNPALGQIGPDSGNPTHQVTITPLVAGNADVSVVVS